MHIENLLHAKLALSFFLFFLKNHCHQDLYVFIFGCIVSPLLRAGFLLLQRAGATLCCSEWASHCGGFSCCGARALGVWASVVVARGLYSADSVVVAHGLSCSTACGIFPDQGLNPYPLHWQADSYPLHHQESPRSWPFSRCFSGRVYLIFTTIQSWRSYCCAHSTDWES